MEIDSGLLRYLPRCKSGAATGLNEALHYALFPGGKRLRPVLTILAARIFPEYSAKEDERVLRAACGVEFVHTSSLILDDLPCMDDAEMRRGNPALHRVYGEPIALLTGIALLNEAYALFADTPELIRETAHCIGLDGMIGGQAIDLGASAEESSPTERNRKTSGLMRLAITAGALALAVPRDRITPLAEAGLQLGMAYQICDDVLDAAPGRTQDIKACSAEVGGLIEQARTSLVDAYGSGGGVVGLMGFIDKLFAAQAAGMRQERESATAATRQA